MNDSYNNQFIILIKIIADYDYNNSNNIITVLTY